MLLFLLNLFDSLQVGFEGTTKAFQNSLTNEGWLVIAAIVVVYIILDVLYGSYIHPITILSILPLTGVGALMALFLTGKELIGVVAMSIILLIGIVKFYYKDCFFSWQGEV